MKEGAGGAAAAEVVLLVPPPPRLVIRNKSQFDFLELRTHPGPGYREVTNWLEAPLPVGDQITFVWEGENYVTVMRLKVEHGRVVAMTTQKGIRLPQGTEHELSVFDEAFRLAKLRDLPLVPKSELKPSDTTLQVFAPPEPQPPTEPTVQPNPDQAEVPDTTPPVFAGIKSGQAASSKSVVLTWDPAKDDRTSADAIRYLVCRSNESGVCGSAFSAALGVKGGTQILVEELEPGQTHFFVVRAQDEAGNLDANKVEAKVELVSDQTGSSQTGSSPTGQPLSGVLSVAAGEYHTCALLTGGGVDCWGDNVFLQLGTGGAARGAAAVVVAGVSSAVSLAAGARTTCVVLGDRNVKCWGALPSKVEGKKLVEVAHSGTPKPVYSRSDAAGAAMGGSHGCVWTQSGEVWCWGDHARGQLGLGEALLAFVEPTRLDSIGGVTGIAAGAAHTCAVQSSGDLYCWGANDHGQLGNGATTDRFSPMKVGGLPGVVGVTAGFEHTCGWLSSGQGYCWGSTARGQADGAASSQDRFTPVQMRADVTMMAAGGEHTCALTQAGEIWCWGRNDYGQSGQGSNSTNVPAGRVSLPRKATAIASGGHHSCALLEDTSLWCWGLNSEGQAGVGRLGYTETPSAVVVESPKP
ncbi:MAG: hypothetical protein HYY13_02550 [Nitrospirae bacterium]|nr:hypothetical protein [Nitrospirota bacterium]